MPLALPQTVALKRWLTVLVLLIVLPMAWLKPLDEQAQVHLETGLKRALATYAVARTINGLISVLQETGVSLQPAGVGMTFAPGQMLDPVNDLVEQFSSIMLAVSVSLGIQLALLKIGGTALVSSALSLALLWWTVCVWRGRSITRWESRLIIASIVLRFAVPMVAAGSELTFRFAMSDQYAAVQKGIESTVEQVTQTSPPQDLKFEPDAAKDAGLWERIKKLPEAARDFEWFKSLRESVDIDARVQKARATYEQIKLRLDSAVEDVIHMIAIFAVQTVLLPLLFLWLLAQVLSLLVTARPAASTHPADGV